MYEPHEHARYIRQSKWHDHPQTMLHLEHCFSLISGPYLDLVAFVVKVNFVEDV